MAAEQSIHAEYKAGLSGARWDPARRRVRARSAATDELNGQRLAAVSSVSPVSGLRLNHRCVWVLQVIGAEPGLSNNEVDERVGSPGKSRICVLLGRLKRLGLIENTQEDPTPYVPNAWRLTHSGRELERAVQHELPSARKMKVVGDPVLAAFEDALARAGARAGAAFGSHEGWLEGIRAGLLALLEFFDEQPALARLLVVDSLEAGPVLRARRSEVLAQLARLLDDERAPARRYPPALTAEAVVSGVLGVLDERLAQPPPGGLVELSNQLMSFIVLPFLGAGAARRELSRPAVAAHVQRKAALELLHGFSGRAMRHPLAPRVLHVIRAKPGLSNVEVARRAGVVDEGHMSRVLARLRRLGLIENRRDATVAPATNVWHLTSSGDVLERALRMEADAADASLSGAVSKTAMALVRAHASARRRFLSACKPALSSARARLLRLAAFALPLLRCTRHGDRRSLPVAGVPSLLWLNKRCRTRYSILRESASGNRHTRRIGRQNQMMCRRSAWERRGVYKRDPSICGMRLRRRAAAYRAWTSTLSMTCAESDGTVPSCPCETSCRRGGEFSKS
jgi:DNA-binding MarR family transcriptional regulator